MAIIHVPGRVVAVSQPDGRGGTFTQRRWQPSHWADSASGKWVPAPVRPGRPGGVTVNVPGAGVTPGSSGIGAGGYQGWSDAEIERRANAMADATIAAQSASIQR